MRGVIEEKKPRVREQEEQQLAAIRIEQYLAKRQGMEKLMVQKAAPERA